MNPSVGWAQVPVMLVTGVADTPMTAAGMGLQWDLPHPVMVVHDLDPARGLLVRTVSDITGVLERVEIELEHACTQCAIREDVIPTLARLAADGRWSSIVARLPIGAEAGQVCRVLAREPRRAPRVRIAGVISALDAATLTDDLTGPDWLVERNLSMEDDQRGVAEVACAQIEYADVVAVFGQPEPAEADLLHFVRGLARPGSMVVTDWPGFDGRQLLAGIHDHPYTESWVHPVPDFPASTTGNEAVWRLSLQSDRPCHPDRFLGLVEDMGAGTHRSRGCFWLPTRPGSICAWDGAAGQVSLGSVGRRGQQRTPVTHLVFTGLMMHGDPREELRAAFDSCLLTDAELAGRGTIWETVYDGLEPWLGAIHNVA
ncbi:CobW family GTP-binding protein [Enemella sp. A6]|uniref:CobW family GTP-binding protein n=1 Tax=Enemella sp. A6 TaxID=3440152 RepID=UPI003EBDBA2F